MTSPDMRVAAPEGAALDPVPIRRHAAGRAAESVVYQSTPGCA